MTAARPRMTLEQYMARFDSKKGEVRARVLAMLNEDTWVRAQDIRDELKRHRHSATAVAKILEELQGANTIEKQVVQQAPGNRVQHSWRLSSEIPAPLYPCVPGVDIGPLAECFGGLTFMQRKKDRQPWQAI